jgi:hypothetical protein
VARRRPARAMRPHHAVRTARATVPAALVTPRVAGALTPADDARMAYPAALGLKRDAFPIHRAVCHPYPQAKTTCCLCPSRGGLGEDRALDCMIFDSTAGWNIARWVANATILDVSEIIHWRHMATKGSDDLSRCRSLFTDCHQMHAVRIVSTATAAPSG